MRKIVVFMILFIIISGCKSETLSTVIINSESPTAVSTLKPAPIDEQLKTTPIVTSNTYINSSGNVQPLKPYLDFIKANHTEIQDDLIFSAKEDMDLDGNDEVILAFGSMDKDPQSSYIKGF
jgi:hypothetical protein